MSIAGTCLCLQKATSPGVCVPEVSVGSAAFCHLWKGRQTSNSTAKMMAFGGSPEAQTLGHTAPCLGPLDAVEGHRDFQTERVRSESVQP